MFTRKNQPESSEAEGSQPLKSHSTRPTGPSGVIARAQHPDIPGYPTAPAEPAPRQVHDMVEPEGSKLTVGRDIHLRGEITSCDILVVEGTVEASMNSRYIRIADRGVFEGECEIDDADISGRFDGNIIVRRQLLIRSTGRVGGKIQYGELQIETGGQLAGSVEVLPKKVEPAQRQPEQSKPPAAKPDEAEQPRAEDAPATRKQSAQKAEAAAPSKDAGNAREKEHPLLARAQANTSSAAN